MRFWLWVAIAVGAGCGGRTIGDDFEPPDSTAGGAAGAGGGGTSSGAGATSGTMGNGQGGIETPIPDPVYPRVEWRGGAGYRDTCPRYGGTHGFLCWHFDGRSSRLCMNDSGCNACACAVPCGPGHEFVVCPASASGIGTPACVKESPNTEGTCMLTCEGVGACPPGMTCTPFPALAQRVCMWVTGR